MNPHSAKLNAVGRCDFSAAVSEFQFTDLMRRMELRQCTPVRRSMLEGHRLTAMRSVK
jgi:hypothetical protein